MDNETAKIQAQELEHENAKICASDLMGQDDLNNEHTSSNVTTQHANQTIGDAEDSPDLEKTQSEPPPPPVKIPRSERRGLFGRFVIIAEVTEPKHYLRPTKYAITTVIALAAVAAPLGSAIIFRKTQPK